MAVSLVTGTSTGIGQAIALALGRAGHEVYATMRNPSRAPELASIAGREGLPIKVLPMDVDDDGSVKKTVADVLAATRGIDVLVNNAGIAATGSVEEIPLAEFRRVMETNFFGTLRCLQAVIPGMRERRSGHVINISSIQGRIVAPAYSPYGASKWAVEAVSESLAQEVKAFGIRVSIVEPGFVSTPIWEKQRAASTSHYPHERRVLALSDAWRKHPVPPSVVADKVVDLVRNPTWILRHPTGADAAPFIQYRASISDEQWVDMQAVESDQEWAAIVKRDFATDVELP